MRNGVNDRMRIANATVIYWEDGSIDHQRINGVRPVVHRPGGDYFFIVFGADVHLVNQKAKIEKGNC